LETLVRRKRKRGRSSEAPVRQLEDCSVNHNNNRPPRNPPKASLAPRQLPSSSKVPVSSVRVQPRNNSRVAVSLAPQLLPNSKTPASLAHHNNSKTRAVYSANRNNSNRSNSSRGSNSSSSNSNSSSRDNSRGTSTTASLEEDCSQRPRSILPRRNKYNSSNKVSRSSGSH